MNPAQEEIDEAIGYIGVGLGDNEAAYAEEHRCAEIMVAAYKALNSRIHAEAQESEGSLREAARAFIKDMETLVSSPELLREALRLAELGQPLTLTDQLSTRLRALLAHESPKDESAEEASGEVKEYRWSFDRYRPRVGKMAEGARCYATTEETARAKVASWYTDPEDEGTTFVLVDKGEPCDWMPDENGKIKCLKCGNMVYTRISGECLDCHNAKAKRGLS